MLSITLLCVRFLPMTKEKLLGVFKIKCYHKHTNSVSVYFKDYLVARMYIF